MAKVDCIPPMVRLARKNPSSDLSGQRFTRLVVRFYAGKSRWLCDCDCGNLAIVMTYRLKTKYTRSCGCLQKDWCRDNAPKASARRKKYIDLPRPEYKCWTALKSRCENPRCSRFKDYGGRGIRVCQRYRVDFLDFLEDIGPRISPTHSIDRADNNGNYSCGHCEECETMGWNPNIRWATKQEQALNRRVTLSLTVNGVTKTINEWSMLYGIKVVTIKDRIARGWLPEAAILYACGKAAKGVNPRYSK